jgi:hypothetical protein
MKQIQTRGEAMGLVNEIKRALKSIDGIIKNQWYVNNENLVELKFKLNKRLEEIEELIASGELPESTLNEWAEATDEQLQFLGIKKIIL